MKHPSMSDIRNLNARLAAAESSRTLIACVVVIATCRHALLQQVKDQFVDADVRRYMVGGSGMPLGGSRLVNRLLMPCEIT